MTPHVVKQTYCRSTACRARIRFARTPTGSTVPLDVEPLTTEQAIECGWDHVYAPIPDTDLFALTGGLEPGVELYRSHFRTCAAPEEFSKR